jgi:archaellum component FlaG (FlaF/FlaG flagellin family)
MKIIVFILSFLTTTALFAQIDGSTKNNSGGIFNSSKKSNATSNFLGIPNRQTEGIFLPKKEEKGVDFTAKSKFSDPGQIWDSECKVNTGNEGKDFDAEKYKNDMDFGIITSNSQKMKVMFRDHMAFDGDRVNVLLNGEIVAENVLLRPGFTILDIPMEVGFNKIVFVALNQGQSGPNTAQLRIVDDSGNIQTNKVWNLLTGVKASVVVVKEK